MDTKKVLILAGLSAVALIAGYFIFFPKIKPEKDKEEQDKKDEEDKLKNYVPESFPLAKGMYGERIRKIRTFFGLTPTDMFDQELETFLYTKYHIKTIPESLYNKYNIVFINV